MLGGAPNITGGIGFPGTNTDSSRPYGVSGAFFQGATQRCGGGTGEGTWNGIRFSAQYSNSIFGNSISVQPSSLFLLPCVKT